MKKLICKAIAFALAGVLMLSACGEKEQPWEETTGSLSYIIAPSATFTAEGGEKTIKFKCDQSWHIECAADWLRFDPDREQGSGVKKSCKTTIICDANPNDSARTADVSIINGDNRIDFTVTQKAPVITLTDEQIAERGIDISRVYEGVVGSITKLKSSDSEFYLGRARASEHFLLLWDKGYDETGQILPSDERTGQSIRVDIEDLLMKAEIYYDTYVTKLGLRGDEGKSYLDKYYMTICLYGTTDWKAEGGGSGNMGALWVSATACQPTGSTIAHEIGHAFQYQVYADYGSKNAGFMQIGGLFWEACANWQSYNLYAEQAFNSENFRVFTENHMRHFHHEHQRYATYWFQFLLTDKYGWEGYGKLWKESKSSEDALQAYQRLFCNGDLMTLNRDLYEYAARCATWDFNSEVVNLDEQANITMQAPIRDFGKNYIGKLGWVSSDDGDGWQKVGYARAPEATGFNVIRLNVPEGSTSISTEFEGLPNASGYNSTKVNASKAGWYMGYVALLENEERVYSEPVFVGASLKGTAAWDVPAGTSKLWMVVACTPTQYYGHSWDEDDTNDAQWPYRIRISGTDLYGTIHFDGSETVSDAEIVKNINVSVADGYAGPSVSFEDEDYVTIGKAFVMQPTEIASKIASDRSNYQSGEVWFGSLESDGTVSYAYSANGYGFWYDGDCKVTTWGNNPTVFTEYNTSSWTFQLGVNAANVEVGKTYTIRPCFVYKDHKVVVTINMNITE